MYDHVDVFLDESGDLGFSPTSSRHLVVAAVATTESRMLARIARKAHRRCGFKGRGVAEFKFNRSRDSLRRFFLGGLAATDSWMVWGAVVKSNAPPCLKEDKNELYQYLVCRTVSELSRRTHAKTVHILIDRRSTEPTVRRALEGRVKSEVATHHAGYFPPVVRVGHMDSMNSEGLQIADHVAGAVFQCLERADGSYLELIEDRIVDGRIYW